MIKLPRKAGRAAATALLLALLAGCASKKGAPPVPPPEAPPKARLEIAPAIGLDQYSSRIPFALELENPGSRPLVLESYECLLKVEGAEAGRLSGRESLSIEAGGSAAIKLEFLADLRGLGPELAGPFGPATVTLRVEALASFRDGSGARLAARAAADSSLPLIREPRLRILSLAIERDILVTTKLALAVEVENPNAFPVELDSLSYDFYGEGKPWSGGSAPEAMGVPAKGSRRMSLAFELNFADRDRALLDLVANLLVVRYRLKGSASVATGLGFLPRFPLAFDEEGRVKVER